MEQSKKFKFKFSFLLLQSSGAFHGKNNYGRIVNVSSVAGKEGNPGASAYSASKAAVIAITFVSTNAFAGSFGVGFGGHMVGISADGTETPGGTNT